MELQACVNQVIHLIKQEFPLLQPLDLQSDTALMSAGRLDSFAVVTLIAALEQEFGIDINVESVQLEQFENPAAIAAFCVAAHAGSPLKGSVKSA